MAHLGTAVSVTDSDTPEATPSETENEETHIHYIETLSAIDADTVYTDENGEPIYFLHLDENGEVVGPPAPLNWPYVVVKSEHEGSAVDQSNGGEEVGVKYVHVLNHNEGGIPVVVTTASGDFGNAEMIFGDDPSEYPADPVEPSAEHVENVEEDEEGDVDPFQEQEFVELTSAGTSKAQTMGQAPNNEPLRSESLDGPKFKYSSSSTVKTYQKKGVGVKVENQNLAFANMVNNAKPQVSESEVLVPNPRRLSLISHKTTSSTASPISSYKSNRLPPVKLKRRPMIDKVKILTNSEFKKQLSNTTDIMRTRLADVGPRTKKEMNQQAFNGIGRYFVHPGRDFHSKPLVQLFYNRLVHNAKILSQTETYTNANLINSKSKEVKEAKKEEEAVETVPHINLRIPGGVGPPLEMFESSASVEVLLRQTTKSFDRFVNRVQLGKGKGKLGENTVNDNHNQNHSHPSPSSSAAYWNTLSQSQWIEQQEGIVNINTLKSQSQ